jgi:hypothetical protein
MTSRGLYRCGWAGALTNSTGVDGLCEQPSDADRRVETVDPHSADNAGRVVDSLECGSGCENGAVPDDEPDGRSFEDVARALADEVHQAVERLSTIDLDDVARAANEEAERARRWIEDLARSLAQTGDTARSPENPPVRHAGPHPRAMPTTEQGVALAALESGRWRIESGTFSVHDGPGPSEPLGLLRELRVSDWVTAEGELTLTGRKALARWLE